MKKLKIFLVKLFAKNLSKSYYVTQLSREVVRFYDNDQNEDMNVNGELKTLTHLVKQSNNENIFIDVGSNKGDYSINLIKAGITGKLLLVDPLRKNLNLANKRILNTNYKNFQLIECALSESTGKQTFYTNEDDALSGHDSLYNMSSIGYTEKTQTIEVKVKKLDDVAVSYNIRNIFFLKIDVEGNELYVLKGAINLLSRGAINFIQFEFGNASKAARVYLHDIVYFLESKQYKIFIIKPNGLLPLQFTPFTEMRYSMINFLAIHKSCVQKVSEIVISR